MGSLLPDILRGCWKVIPTEIGPLRASVWISFFRAQVVFEGIYALLNRMIGFLANVTRTICHTDF
jgi:hypothetical protein